MLWLLFLLFTSAHARCHYLPPAELVPEYLVVGVPAHRDAMGTVVSKVLFDWTKASPYYHYRIIESAPESEVTNVTLGSTNKQSSNTTELAVFRRVPGGPGPADEPLENEDTYHIVVEVFSDCDLRFSITRATYDIDLFATYEFTHNFTSAYANFSSDGWLEPGRLIMHPDIQRELTYIVNITETQFITVMSSVDIIGGENGMCAGVNATIATPCFAELRVSIVRTVRNIQDARLLPLHLSYGLSQFSRDNCTLTRTFNGSLPLDFNVSRKEPSIDYEDRRFDICQGFFTSDGNVTEHARENSHAFQEHSISFNAINASCTYRLFDDECSMTPFVYIMGWFDYDFFNATPRETLFGTTIYNFTE